MSSTAQSATTETVDRREQILDAAIEVFGRQGYRKGSLKEVAVAVGLTVQGVLHHFSTKEALLSALLERRNIRRSDRVTQVEQDQGVVAMMRVLLQENLENPGFMRLFVTLAAEATDPAHPAHQYFQDRYATTQQRFSADFADDIRSGRAAPQLDPEDAAVELIALCDGLQLHYLLRPQMDLLAAYDRSVRHFQPQP